MATFVVTTPVDVIEPGDALTSLREAVDLANSNPGADSITFADDVFASPQALLLTRGELTITETLLVTGPGQHLLTIEPTGASRIFSAVSPDEQNLTIQGMTLRGGTTTAAGDAGRGGTILFDAPGTLTLNLTTIADSSTRGDDAHGGAVFTELGNVVLQSTQFLRSQTEGDRSSGGAIHVSPGALIIRDSRFENNRTLGTGSRGGAVFASGAVVSIEQSEFNDNSTEGDMSDGGAIFSAGGLSLIDSQVSGNVTRGADADGGGLFTSTYLSILNSDLSNNRAEGNDSGGGAVVADSASVFVTNSSLTGNRTTGSSGHGGALFAVRSALFLRGATISQNRATGAFADGGGIAAFVSDLTVNGSTVAFNEAESGGGIAFIAADENLISIENSIVAGNTDFSAAPDLRLVAEPELISVRASLIGDNLGTDLAEAQTPDEFGNLIGDTQSLGLIDPNLGALFQAGLTKIHPVDSTSPAFNAGSNLLAFSSSTDQRGAPFVRISGARVDMGAFESQIAPVSSFVVTTAIDEFDFSNDEVSLREAVHVSNGNPGADVIQFDVATMGDQLISLQLGEMSITDSLTIAAEQSGRVTIDGLSQSRLFAIAAEASDVQLRHLILRGGTTTTERSGGGAIRSMSTGTLSLEQTQLIDNHTYGSDSPGGAIDAAAGLVSLLHTHVEDNTTSGVRSGGGGLHVNGEAVFSLTTFLGNSTFGTESDGGAILQSGDGRVRLIASSLIRNATNHPGTRGGGLAAGTGGLEVTNSTISGNLSGGDGGGIALLGNFLGATTIDFSTIVLNESRSSGGGIYIGGSSGTPHQIRRSIIAANLDSGAAPDLGGATNPSTVGLDATLLGDNLGTGLLESQTPDANSNLIGSSLGAGVIDPLLGPLGSRGGVTLSHSLVSGSPAIDGATSQLTIEVEADQRGVPFVRQFGDAPDMGSFEAQTLSDSQLFVVTTIIDELDFTNEEVSLREAIELATGSDGSETIRFDPSIFSTEQTISLERGELVIPDSMHIQGPGRDLLTIDAMGKSRVMLVASENNEIVVEISGMTLTGGVTATEAPSSESPARPQEAHGGGGIRFVGGGSLNLSSVAVIGNRTTAANGHGGGIFVTDGELTIRSSGISGNRTEGGSAAGGGIRIDNGTIRIVDSVIAQNTTAGDFSGGGALSLQSSGASIETSVIASNVTTGEQSTGGAIEAVDAVVTISGSEIALNRTEGMAAAGGGVAAAQAAVSIRSSAIYDNGTSGASARGGGAALDESTLSLVNSTLSGNRATGPQVDGGGISLQRGSQFAANNATITLNSATGTGGGIHVGNSLLDTVALTNTILAGNLTPLFSPDIKPPFNPINLSVRSSLIGDNRGTLLAESQTPDVRGNLIGSSTGQGVINPRLAPLEINAGRTPTHKPLADSPVVNAGNDALAQDASGESLSSDQRGAPFERIFEGVDIGAFERQPPRQPIIFWTKPNNIFDGTPLSATQLNASTQPGGTFLYTPEIGTVLASGDDQLLTTAFTPDDLVHYAATTASTTINVVERSDLGDAPASYATLREDDGPRHAVGSLFLGSGVDAEVDGIPTLDASGDGADDDGVSMLTSIVADPGASTVATLSVTASNRGLLDAWIDFDGDGNFDPDEHLGNGESIQLNRGENRVAISVPAGSVAGPAFARFRLSSAGDLLPTGPAIDGEVEDHIVTILDGTASPEVQVHLPRGVVTIVADSGQISVDRQGEPMFLAPASSIDRFYLIGGATSNVVTIDSTLGNPIPIGGIEFDGAGPVNTLRLIGATEPIDLSVNGNLQLRNIDVIDINDSSAHVVRVDAAAARAMDPTGGGVILVGDAGDRLEIVDGESWRMDAPVSVVGLNFSSVRLPDTFLQIDFGSPWQNLAQSSDVNNDGAVTAGDALRIINELGRRFFSGSVTGELVDPDSILAWPGLYYDVNGDGAATALDALRVINEVARDANQSMLAEFESPFVSTMESSLPPLSSRAYPVDLALLSRPTTERQVSAPQVSEPVMDLGWLDSANFRTVELEITTEPGHNVKSSDEGVRPVDDLMREIGAAGPTGDNIRSQLS